jgi:hypothetical protein
MEPFRYQVGRSWSARARAVKTVRTQQRPTISGLAHATRPSSGGVLDGRGDARPKPPIEIGAKFSTRSGWAAWIENERLQ